ncbi:phosphotransferase family protein [Streptomyces sp. NPDC059894]|uniref:phosphotransferase family protein n=1 Tax=unclassified Streptomyces TaxID=2593676 RepID=UPI003659E895
MSAAQDVFVRIRSTWRASRGAYREELPRVRIDHGTQATPWRVVEAVREQLGLDVALLRVTDGDTVDVEELPSSPPGTGTPDTSFGGPWWQLPGWYGRMLALVDEQLGRLGTARVGRPRQVRHWDVSAVLRVVTDTRPLWFKAVPDVFGHEGALAHWVSEAVPRQAPGVPAFGNAWLLAEEMAPERGQPAEHVIAAVARVQQASVGRAEELLKLGCPYRGPDTVPGAVAGLLRRTHPLSPAERDGLAQRLAKLEAVVAAVMDLGVPDTLVHGDIQPENARWTGDRWQIIDWTDGCVAHPFVELARPLMTADDTRRAEAERQFAAAWSAVLPHRILTEASRFAAVLGAAHQLETYRLMTDSIGAHPELVRLVHLWVSHLVEALDSVDL